MKRTIIIEAQDGGYLIHFVEGSQNVQSAYFTTMVNSTRHVRDWIHFNKLHTIRKENEVRS